MSRTLIIKAREIKQEKGILPTIKFTRQSSVLDSTKELIKQFYCNDENSKVLPGKKDCVSISKGVYEQKRLILLNFGELYAAFAKEHETLKVGLSVFYSLKPKWCVFAGSSGTHIVCVCQTHEDVKLVLHALRIKTHYRELISSMVCDSNSRTCMLRLCSDCFTIDEVDDFLRDEVIKSEAKKVEDSQELPMSDEKIEEFWKEKIEYYQWKSSEGHTELVTQVSIRSNLINILAELINNLIPHDFIAQNQGLYVQEMKNTLPDNKVVVLMDFAMNFNCLLPKEIQSYHWTKMQVTLHPVVIFYRSNEEVKHHSICFISDDLTHDVSMVKLFQERTMAIVKELFPEVDTAEYVTDGCASQYKNKSHFYHLCHHINDYGIKATHSFFATSHGKSLCDALSGIIKRMLSRASLQCTEDHLINDAKKVYAHCKVHATIALKIQFEFVSKDQVDLQRSKAVDPDKLVCIPGTRSFHYFEPQSGM